MHAAGRRFAEAIVLTLELLLVFRVPLAWHKAARGPEVEWVGTQLTYVACCARGSSVINIVIFKHNENKMRQLYTINILPEL